MRQVSIARGSDAPMVVQAPDSRNYAVTGLSIAQRVEPVEPWDAKEFAHVSDASETANEMNQDGNRLTWTLDPTVVCRIDAT